MSMPQDQDAQQSQYPEIRLPEGGWQSSIPPHLLDNADPQMSWLMQEMSKNTQATEFCSRAAVDTNGQVRKTNGRLKSAEAKVIELQSDVAALKLQMAKIDPIANTFSTVRVVFSNKVFLVVLGGFLLFILGYNRDVLPAIARYFFGS